MVKKLLDTFGGQVLGSGATGLLGGAADAIFGGISARRNWKYQQKAMAQQQQYNLENMQRQFEYQQRAWRMENEYNDPRNAVARWRAAGIAPQAVFGSSPGGSGVAGSMSTPDPSNPNASSPGGSHGYAPVMTLAESMRLRNERKIADATVDKLSAEADKLRGDTKDSDQTKRAQTLLNRAAELENDNKSLQNEILSIQRDFEERKQTGILGDLNARIDEIISRTDLNEESRQNLIETRDLIKAQTEESKARTKTEDVTREGKVEKLTAEINNLISSTDLSNEKSRTEFYNRLVDVLGLYTTKTMAEEAAKQIVKKNRGKNWMFERFSTQEIERLLDRTKK